jgi:hypothetical protein
MMVYMGSGKIIQHAIAKHGVLNFSKVILEHFDTSDAMYAREAELVNAEFLERDDVYNLRRGGHGGFDYINKYCGNQGIRMNSHMSNETRRKGAFKMIEICKRDGLGVYSDSRINIFKDKSFQDEMTNRARIHNMGSKWVTNGIENRKIKKDVLIPDGWKLGRVIKPL